MRGDGTQMETLMDASTGRYLVTTISGSRYLIDLDGSTLKRLPAFDLALDRSLRRDGQDIHIVAIKDCTVGREMQLIVDLRLPGVFATKRRSTEVRRIEALGEDIDMVWDKR